MSLQLDARQRAMLREMGVPLLEPLARWQVAAPAAVPPLADRSPAAAPAATIVAPTTRPTPATARTADTAHLAPPQEGEADALTWEALGQAVTACRACPLGSHRRNAVVGAGPAQADWLVVGEPPGEDDDARGEPFQGASGQLLDNMLAALGLDRRRHVYVANVLRCRPPGDRNPEADELAQCSAFLRRQVQLLQPRVILALGRFAAQSLLQSTEPIGRLRGQVHTYEGVPVVVSFPPAYLLRNLPDKAKAWADLCLARSVWQRASA